MDSNIVYQIAVWLIPLVIAIVFHEIAHGLVARQLGDPTAQERGRLTLNPIKHVDPFGTVILPLILAISHAPMFGWARPVPVNYAKLRHPRRDMVLVALAGPGMNLLLAFIGVTLLAATLAISPDPNGVATRLVTANALNFVLINIFLGVFNLLPIPPFDGGHVARGAIPQHRPLLASGVRHSSAGPAGDFAEGRRHRPCRVAAGGSDRDRDARPIRHPRLRCPLGSG